MPNKKTILILTSGGLAPALNATLYGVIKTAKKKGYNILGGINGWSSLVENDKIINLTKLNVESIKNRGGNILKSSRINPFKVKNGIKILKETIEKNVGVSIPKLDADITDKLRSSIGQGYFAVHCININDLFPLNFSIKKSISS